MAKGKSGTKTKRNNKVLVPNGNRGNLIARQDIRDQVLQEALRDTWKQFMVDTLCITLNEQKYMKKNVFGWLRLRKLCENWMEVVDFYVDAITASSEADYKRTKMDQRLQQIAKKYDTIEPFEVRYPWIAKIFYGKK